MRETARIVWHYLHTRYGLRFHDRMALERHQQKQLRQFQNRVLSGSPYYAAFKGKALDAYPLMNKAIMMANFDAINTRHLKLNDAMALALNAEITRNFSDTLGDVTVGLSSGTSGTRGIFAASRAEQLKWAGIILSKALPSSLLRKHKIAFFLRANNQLYQAAHQRRRVEIHFFDLSLPFEEHLIALNQLQPTQIIAPAQTLRAIAEAQNSKKISITPGRVTSVAEVLDPLDEKVIEAAFKQPVHQVYQCTEGFLGCSCAHGRIHLNEEFVYVEKEWLDEEKRRFIPIITDFSRTTQPIVRYRLDDILVVDDRPCPCGAPTTTISRIEGRMDDVLYGKNAAGASISLFPDFLRHAILGATALLRDYTLIQESPDTLLLAVEPVFPEDEYQKLQDAICNAFMAHNCHSPIITRIALVATVLSEKRRRIVRRFPSMNECAV